MYELYTSASGFYVCLLMARAVAMFTGWLRQVFVIITDETKQKPKRTESRQRKKTEEISKETKVNLNLNRKRTRNGKTW